MSLFLKKNINSHLKLHLLRLDTSKKPEEAKMTRLSLLASTRMFKQILEQTKGLQGMQFPSLPEKIKKAQEKTVQEKKALDDENVLKNLQKLDDLCKEQDPNFEEIDEGQDKIFKCAKITFDEGNYEKCLQIIILLEKQDMKEDLWLKTTWARLYCEILLEKHNEAVKTTDSLRKKIDQSQEDVLKYAKDRATSEEFVKKMYVQRQEFLWMAAITYFTRAKDEDFQKFLDLCTSDKNYFSIVQLTAPELLRYIIAAIILNKTLQNNRNFDLFKLNEVISRKIVDYSDSFVKFIESLCVEFDFEQITTKITEIVAQIKNDVILAPLKERLIESMHFIYFKMLCRVYESVSIGDVASFTGKSKEDAELWILGYIRSGDIEAKLDSVSELIINSRNRQNHMEKYSEVAPSISTFVNSLARLRDTK